MKAASSGYTASQLHAEFKVGAIECAGLRENECSIAVIRLALLSNNFRCKTHRGSYLHRIPDEMIYISELGVKRRTKPNGYFNESVSRPYLSKASISKAQPTRIEKVDLSQVEYHGRALVESLALTIQGCLLLRDNATVAEAFCLSRYAEERNGLLGALPAGVPCREIIDRARPE